MKFQTVVLSLTNLALLAKGNKKLNNKNELCISNYILYLFT